MIAHLQRVKYCALEINHALHAEIKQGFLVLLGVTHSDGLLDVEYLAKKIVNLRIFSDNDGKMNLSVKDIGGDIMLVSQFTLYADTQKGNRPSFTQAARPEYAIPLYEAMIAAIEKHLEKPVKTGIFGADMQITLLNDGPVTIMLDSKDKPMGFKG